MSRPPGRARDRRALVQPLSETFIADHVRTLAPGRTVLVSQDGRGSAGYGCPVLGHVQPAFTAFGPLDASAKDLRFRLRRRFGPALSFDDRMRLVAFLKEQEVTVVLAEYGPMGVLAARRLREPRPAAARAISTASTPRRCCATPPSAAATATSGRGPRA